LLIQFVGLRTKNLSTEMGRPTILVLGSSGLLGPYLSEEAEKYGRLITSSRSSGDFNADLSSISSVERLLTIVKPDWVIHAAGFTDVDGCEKDAERAFQDNALSTENVALKLSPNSSLIYISTDQVYPLDKGPHIEDRADPVNVYGKSKFAGEKEALRHPRSLVLRTSFFGPSRTIGRQSLDDFMLGQLRRKEPFILFSDVFFSPLHMKTLSESIFLAVSKGLKGVFNLGSRMGRSKAEFGMLIADQFKLDHSVARLGLSSSIKGRAIRPLDLRLNSNKIEQALGIELPTLLEEIRKL